MLFPSADENLDSAAFACTTARISCGSAKRNGITFTFGGTENCTFGDDPAASVVHAALYSMGRMLGLEGLVPDTYQDAMEYPPDLVTGLDLAGSPAYDDACHDIENQIGFNDQGEPTEQQIECTSLDHVTCDAADQQNSHQDLLAICGAAPAEADTAAPELTNVVPEDGTVHPADEPFVMDVDIADNDPTVGVRWTIQSDALMSDDFPEGAITKCTNDICTLNWDEVFKPTDSDWVFNELSPPTSGWPSGEYVITLEAADLHGNVAETITVTVTVENEGPGTGGSGDGGTGTGSDGGVDDSGFGEESGSGDAGDASDESGSGSASGGENDEGGCGCTQGSDAGGAALMLFGLAGLGFARRRRRQ
jgi:MYXO-CTERM domain-containing protein